MVDKKGRRVRSPKGEDPGVREVGKGTEDKS